MSEDFLEPTLFYLLVERIDEYLFDFWMCIQGSSLCIEALKMYNVGVYSINTGLFNKLCQGMLLIDISSVFNVASILYNIDSSLYNTAPTMHTTNTSLWIVYLLHNTIRLTKRLDASTSFCGITDTDPSNPLAHTTHPLSEG